MNKPKITFGKIQLAVKKDEQNDADKQENRDDAAASVSGLCFDFHHEYHYYEFKNFL